MSPSRLQLLLTLSQFVAVLFVFRPALDCGFVNLDDPAYVQNNPIVRGSAVDAFTTVHAGYWIPLTWLSYQCDYHLYGLSPRGYHRTNVLWHAATAALLFLVLCRLTEATGRSWVVAALFAVHPVQVESVAWVTERKDVLSTFFLVLTLAAYARYASKPGVGRYLLVVLCFVLGLMAKPMLVTLPVLLLLLDHWPLGRRGSSWTTLLIEKAPLFVLALAAGVLTIVTQKMGTAVRSLDELSLYARFGNAVAGYGDYLCLLAWPYPLAVFYPHPEDALPVWKVVGVALLLLASTSAVLLPARARAAPFLATGWLWFLITLGPVSGVLQAGWQGQADRFLYVPAIGIFLAVVWGIEALFRRRPGLSLALAGVVLAACLALTRLQLRHWRDSLTLWEHALAVTPDNFTMRDSLAAALLDRHRTEEAIPHLKRARALKPTHELAPLLLGVAYVQQNRPGDAVAELKNALEIREDYLDAHTLLAEVFTELDQLEDAERHAQRALELEPRSAAAHHSLAAVRLRQPGKEEEALDLLRRAVQIDPHARTTRQRLIQELRRQSKNEEAEQQEQALRRYFPEK